MSNRQLLRLAVITAFVFFVQNTASFAQRARNTELYNAEYGSTGKIAGIITDSTGPVKGATIALSRETRVILSVETDDNGNYSFGELRPGTYNISCYKEGYRKRIIQQIPVVETFYTHNDLIISKIEDRYDERTPKIQYYEKLATKKVEKMK